MTRAAAVAALVGLALQLALLGGAVPVRAGSSTSAVTAAGVPPLNPLRLTRGFDPPASRYGAGHRGVDLAGIAGQPVRAVLTGRVAFTGSVAGVGVLSLDIGAGRRVTFEPVLALVPAGALVSRGSVVARLRAGRPGCSAAACLHWGLIVRGVYADPLVLLGFGQVRLLPWDGLPSSAVAPRRPGTAAPVRTDRSSPSSRCGSWMASAVDQAAPPGRLGQARGHRVQVDTDQGRQRDVSGPVAPGHSASRVAARAVATTSAV